MAELEASIPVFGADGERKCSALSLVDMQRCQATATSINGLFCSLHAKQCHGLYVGYKRRNTKLDELRASPPACLAIRVTKLPNDFFTDLNDEIVLAEIHEYLLKQYHLLDLVIRARKLHHSHFYAQNMDYGHQQYLDILLNHKVTVTRALERVGRRTTEVLYKKRKWFQWVTERQEEDEKIRESEKQKIKREAALFKRQAKEVERKMRELRLKEERRLQEEFLERTYQERLADDLGSDEETWDPIRDVLETERDTYIDLIKHFLWLQEEQEEKTNGEPQPENGVPKPVPGGEPHRPIQDSKLQSSHEEPYEVAPEKSEETIETEKAAALSSKIQRKKKNKAEKKQAAASTGPQVTGDAPRTPSQATSTPTNGTHQPAPVIMPAQRSKQGKAKKIEQPDAGRIERREDMRSRLIEGMKINIDGFEGCRVLKGSAENPEETSDRMPPMPADVVDQLLLEVAEIKDFIFCRLLLGHAALLPAALRASTVEEFYRDPSVTTSDLRDLCLKMEQPPLQDIRDACADFFRGSEETDDTSENVDEGEDSSDSDNDGDWIVSRRPDKHSIPNKWKSRREKKLAAKRQSQRPPLTQTDSGEEEDEQRANGWQIDFGRIDRDDDAKRKISVKVCGRQIYYYPSSKSLSRRGWLHFSIIAKDCNFYRAAELCKSWDEFFELNVLAVNLYFPTPTWALAGDRLKSQFLMMGFIPSHRGFQAEAYTFSENERIHGRGRVHATQQARNYICGQMRRNDPASRRFLQYVSMQSAGMLLVVRDGKTGKVIEKPPEDEAWLARQRIGHGRASRTPWKILKPVDKNFFVEMEEKRAFRLGFDDFYDVYIWSKEPGETFERLYSRVFEMLIKAHRVTRPNDLYRASFCYLKTLTTDETGWVRNIKPNEKAMSLYDIYQSDDITFHARASRGKTLPGIPPRILYHEADRLEDEVLFPEGEARAERFRKIRNKLIDFEQGRLKNFHQRFAYDMDTDDSSVFDESDYTLSGEEEAYDSGWDSGADEADRSLGDDQEGKEGEEEEEDTGEGGDEKKNFDEILGSIPGYTNFSEAAKKAEEINNQFGPAPRASLADSEKLRTEFMEFMDRHKAAAFKEAWHKADLEPGAPERWQEFITIREASITDYFLLTKTIVRVAMTFKFLGYHPDSHIRSRRDMLRACAMTTVCFPVENHSFKHADSLLFKQGERAKQLPDRRGYRNAFSRGAGFFKTMDQVKQKCERGEGKFYDELPLEWDIAIRPKIAQLFRQGIICVSYLDQENIPGQAFAAAEGDRPLDLFFDFRLLKDEVELPAKREDPTKISIGFLRDKVRSFASSRPQARFSFLRVWSSPHFYPLMIGSDRRSWTSFRDLTGRIWEWKYIPKDMPFSEFSIHFNLSQRIEPFRKALRDKTLIKRDMVIVMAEDAEELQMLTSAVTFAIQTRPWRLEVDYWKSFINVDIGFMDSLQDEWYD